MCLAGVPQQAKGHRAHMLMALIQQLMGKHTGLGVVAQGLARAWVLPRAGYALSPGMA